MTGFFPSVPVRPLWSRDIDRFVDGQTGLNRQVPRKLSPGARSPGPTCPSAEIRAQTQDPRSQPKTPNDRVVAVPAAGLVGPGHASFLLLRISDCVSPQSLSPVWTDSLGTSVAPIQTTGPFK